MPKASFEMDDLDWRKKEAQEIIDLIKAGQTGRAIIKIEAILAAIELRKQHLGDDG